MGQQREWDRDAERERKRAYRERQRLQAQLDLAAAKAKLDEPEEPLPASVEEMLDLLEPARRAPISEDEYARKIRREALDYSKSINETDAPFQVGGETLRNRRSDRLVRAEAYARWRYRGFLAGEVAGL